MSLEPSNRTVDISQLYFSIEPEINTNIEFNFEVFIMEKESPI